MKTTHTRAQPDAVVDVDVKLLYLAYDRLPLSMAIAVAAIVILVGVVWPFFPSAIYLLWITGIALVVAVRLFIWWLYRRARPEPAALDRWRTLYLIAAVLAGAATSLGPVLIVIAGEPDLGAGIPLLVGALLSVGAVAMNSMAAQRTAMQAFLVVALAPFIAALASYGDRAQGVLALVLLAGMVALLIVGRASSAGLRALLETQSRLHHALEAADLARSQAEAASQAKSRFLANMSHELRTPLNAVIGAAQLLRTQTSNPDQQTYLVSAIERSGNNLLGLIENILDLSRIEAGELRLRPVEFDLVECIDSAVASAALAAQAKGIQLVADIAEDIGTSRIGDPDRLRQVVMNLLGNAVKFTARGEVRVQVTKAGTGPNVRFRVSDTGVGVDASVLPHIFEPFRQGEDSAERRYGGSGLGLAIVQQLVEAMGGVITVVSVPGRGSTFEFEIPLLPARYAEPGVELGAKSTISNSRAGGRTSMATVLVIEDDELNRVVVGSMLAQAGYQVHLASDGFEALRLIKQSTSFDLVLMDLQMPGMDGLEVTRRLRAGEAGDRGRQIPIVALTANAFSEDKQACLAAGMNDYLTKPVVYARLLSTLQRWLGPSDSVAAATTPAPTDKPNIRRVVFDSSVLASMPMVADGSSPGFARKVLLLFVESASKIISETRSAYDNADQQTLLRLVHTLKSSSATIGAFELSDLAHESESILRSGQVLPAEFTEALADATQRLKTTIIEYLRQSDP